MHTQFKEIPIKLGDLEIGTVGFPRAANDICKFNFIGDLKMGSSEVYPIENSYTAVYMYGFCVLDFDVHIVHFQVVDNETNEIRDYVGITDFNLD